MEITEIEPGQIQIETKNTENNKQNTHQQLSSTEQFVPTIEKMTFLKNPLNELANAPSAIVYYKLRCCQIRCCIPISCCCTCICDCGDYYKYNTLTNINGNQKFLFKNIARIKCNLLTTDKLCRFDNCKSLSMTSMEEYEKEVGIVFSEMVREPGCSCFGLFTTYLNVNISIENRLAGIIKFRSCCSFCCKGTCCCAFLCNGCYEFFYCCDILSPNKNLVYTIYIRKCCISCIPVDCCGYIRFSIKNTSNKEVGSIEARRNCCNICGICPMTCTYSINFPPDATPDLKLTIIKAVIAIDMFYF